MIALQINFVEDTHVNFCLGTNSGDCTHAYPVTAVNYQLVRRNCYAITADCLLIKVDRSVGNLIAQPRCHISAWWREKCLQNERMKEEQICQIKALLKQARENEKEAGHSALHGQEKVEATLREKWETERDTKIALEGKLRSFFSEKEYGYESSPLGRTV